MTGMIGDVFSPTDLKWFLSFFAGVRDKDEVREISDAVRSAWDVSRVDGGLWSGGHEGDMEWSGGGPRGTKHSWQLAVGAIHLGLKHLCPWFVVTKRLSICREFCDGNTDKDYFCSDYHFCIAADWFSFRNSVQLSVRMAVRSHISRGSSESYFRI